MARLRNPTLGLIAALSLVAACQKEEESPPPKQPEGRAETRSIRNTEAVGYSGNAVADKVDAGLNANDERVKETEKTADE